MTQIDISDFLKDEWAERICIRSCTRSLCELECSTAELPQICSYLFNEMSLSFAGLIVEEKTLQWELRYVFHGEREAGFVHVVVKQPLAETSFPTISLRVHAADWHEREARYLFGLVFEGHPRVGEQVLSNARWQDDVGIMRRNFESRKSTGSAEPDSDWLPQIVEASGSFVMPIGPIYSGITESVNFLLETVGEDVIRTIPRLFYKYRAIEKTAEGRKVNDTLLLAERFAATTAFAHGLAFCQAVENISNIAVPPRARVLRVFLAELERFRHHVGAIQEICESTALVVANSQAAILEEELLRLSCLLTGHRYLFGVVELGGLTRVFEDEACRDALRQAEDVLRRLGELENLLRTESTFLDRLEEVGIISQEDARSYGLVGPIARASGVTRDLRKSQPYSDYEAFTFDVPCEQEGDGYARLRLLFAEARQSVAIMEQALSALPAGEVQVEDIAVKPGAALGSVEAPRGATFHWVRIDDNGCVERYRIVTPSFTNWHGFHLAAENFAFQDFPIILATCALSVSESDR